jgi:hypothetical protein
MLSYVVRAKRAGGEERKNKEKPVHLEPRQSKLNKGRKNSFALSLKS